MEHKLQEIGGYIGLEKCDSTRLHEEAIALNSGRSCLAYLIQAKKIRRLWLPYFLCSSVNQICQKENVLVHYYHIDENFQPENIKLQDEEWLYLVNYYGQIDNENIALLVQQYQRVIIDATQAYFQLPWGG